MATLKYNIPLLDKNIRFSLWQVKIHAIFVHMDLDDALLDFDKMSQSWNIKEKQSKDHNVLSQIHLHLSNQITGCLERKNRYRFMVEIRTTVYDKEFNQ